MNHRSLIIFIGALLSLGIAGCTAPRYSAPASSPTVEPSSASPPPAESLLPARPVELRLDKIDPCTLLTPSVQAQLGVQQATSVNDADEFHSLNCLWDNNGGVPDNTWQARAVTKQGAEYSLDSVTPVRVVRVGGFAAVESSSPTLVGDTHCILVIDVAQGQNLRVLYGNMRGDYPGINHAVACQQATKAAELMIQNLRARAQ